MKTIKISNGEIRKGYEFKDLSEVEQTKILLEQIKFEVEIMDENSPFFEIAEEMEQMKTPWFLESEIFHKHKQELIDTIETNNYLFDEDGKLLHLHYFMKGDKVVKTTYGKQDYLCEVV